MSFLISQPPSMLDCGGRLLDLSCPQVMGVLNTTPDSFSDGGTLHVEGKLNLTKVLRRVENMLNAGAAIIDVGGESTRPGALAVSLDQEMSRVVPVVEAIAARFNTIISVDTSSPELMRAAADVGAGLLNDVRALDRSGAVEAVAETGLPVCLMHMLGSPEMMQDNPSYQDPQKEVASYLLARADVCLKAGIDAGKILLDPGFGFGKTTEHNLQLLNRLPVLAGLGYPVLVGLSRKSIIGKVLNRDIDNRLAGGLALAVMAVARGASIIRTHDVAETVDAVRMAQAVMAEHS